MPFERSLTGSALKNQTAIFRENHMWANLKTFAGGFGIHAERLEPGIPAGIPDLLLTVGSSDGRMKNPLSLPRASIFIETKYNRHKLRPDQRAFLRRHYDSGGRAVIWSINEGISMVFVCRDLPIDCSLPSRNMIVQEDASRIDWERLIRRIWEFA